MCTETLLGSVRKSNPNRNFYVLGYPNRKAKNESKFRFNFVHEPSQGNKEFSKIFTL